MVWPTSRKERRARCSRGGMEASVTRVRARCRQCSGGLRNKCIGVHKYRGTKVHRYMGTQAVHRHGGHQGQPGLRYSGSRCRVDGSG